jgi:hypothetical protein
MNLERYVQLARDRHVAMAEAYHDSGRRGKAREHLCVAVFYDNGGFTRQLCKDLEELRDCMRDTLSGVVREPRGARRRLRTLMGLYDAHDKTLDDDGDDDDSHDIDTLPLHPSRDAGDDEEHDDDDDEAASKVKAKPHKLTHRQRRPKSRTKSRPRGRSSFRINL